MSKAKSGIILAITSSFMGAIAILSTKGIMKYSGINAETLSIIWAGIAFLYCRFYLGVSGRNIEWKESKKEWRIILVYGIMESFSTLLFLLSLSMMNAAVLNFLININLVLVLIFGVLFLKERYNIIEIFGVLLVFGGVVVMGFTNEKGSTLPVILLMCSCLFYSANTILLKKYLKKISPVVLVSWRALLIFIFTLVYAMIQERLVSFDKYWYIAICIGCLFGSCFHMISFVSALKYIEASKVTLLRASMPLIVLFGSTYILGDKPSSKKIIGGLVLLFGVIVLTFGKMKVSVPVEEETLL